MKKILWLTILLASLMVVSAAEVCIVAQLKEDKAVGDCINVNSGTDGYTTLESSDVSFTWSESGAFGRALCKIEGTGDSVSGTGCAWGSNYWGFYILMNNAWSYMPVGFDTPGDCWDRDLTSYGGHYCAEDDDIISFRYGAYGTLPDMLFVDEVKIYVDDDKSSADEDGGKIKDVKPDSEIKIEVKLENIYPDEVDIEIEDISVEAIIYNMDDDDDIEEESNEIELEAEEDGEITLEFDIPFEVDHGDYDMDLIITAEDEKGISYSETIDYDFEVEKERHELVFTDVELDVEKIRCSGVAVLDVDLANIGRDDEDVILTIKNTNLGIDIKDEFELDKDPFDDDSRYNKRFTLFIDETDSGVYPIIVEADYGSKDVRESIDLEVIGCHEEVVDKTVDVTNEPNVEEVVVITEQVQQPIIDVETETFDEGYGNLLIVGIIVVIIILTFAITFFIAMKT